MDMTEMQPLVQAAALEITTQDPDVHTVGVALRWNQPVLRAVRRSSLRAQARALPERVEGLSLLVEEAPHALVPLHKIPGASAQAATLPEQEQQRPLTLGLQVQNIDHDLRDGAVARGYRTVGTLGCFVQVKGEMQMLSNNHVLAGENDAQINDRIQQPGALGVVPEQVVAELSAFVPLVFVPEGQLGMTESVNLVDAATARLSAGTDPTTAYLSHHRVRAPGLVRDPRPGEEVYKVGRTTGLTRGQSQRGFGRGGTGRLRGGRSVLPPFVLRHRD